MSYVKKCDIKGTSLLTYKRCYPLWLGLQKNVVYSQDDLCEELGISRTPVREALIELQNENFISFVREEDLKLLNLQKRKLLI